MSPACGWGRVASEPHEVADPTADAIRSFNRTYTDLIGTLRKRYLGSMFSLLEARALYEIGTHPGTTATGIRSRAHFDQGHLSRILMRLERTGAVERSPAAADKRAMELRLTPRGSALFADLEAKAREQARTMIAHLSPAEQETFLGAMDTIRRSLRVERPGSVTIREGRSGDVGWLLHRHAMVYRDEFGFDERFEMYVAKGIAPYLEGYDPERDRLWVAKSDERPVGTIAVHHVDDRPGWAKLRWYLVEDRQHTGRRPATIRTRRVPPRRRDRDLPLGGMGERATMGDVVVVTQVTC